MTDIPPLDDDAVLWSGDPAGRALLVLLHGYGADERDLFELTSFLPEEFTVAAVRAPWEPPFPIPGRAWYPLDGPEARDHTAITAATDRLLEWLDRTASDAASVGLLGFSQGGAVSIQALRRDHARFGFAVNLSGYVAPGELAGDAALAERKPPVFWGRGTRDDVIPESLVAHTVDWLPAHVDLSGAVYDGLTHSVSEGELADVRKFLEKQLDDAAPAAD